MNDSKYVRELSPAESVSETAKSGDRLPDGSVLLWQEDINRMGLEALRSLLFQKVVREHATLVLGHVDDPWQSHSADDDQLK